MNADKLPLPSNPNELLDQPYVAGGNEYDALWRTMCADSFFASSSSSAGLDGRAMFRRVVAGDKAAVQAWRRWAGRQNAHSAHQPPSLKDFSSPEEHALVVEADRAIRSAGLQRRYFKTNTGYMGLGHGVQRGDEVFAFRKQNTVRIAPNGRHRCGRTLREQGVYDCWRRIYSWHHGWRAGKEVGSRGPGASRDIGYEI
jgi:hypothetical protein